MVWGYDQKARDRERQRQHAADAPDRARRLSPEMVTLWTDIIRDAANEVQPGKRPCDYAPWDLALSIAGERHGLVETSGGFSGGSRPPIETASRFSAFLWDVALPAWPEPRRDLIGFALAVLEADVKLFRSGYAQKYLIKRLQQSALEGDDLARIDALLRRAVSSGTGFEEYREWCRLAGHLVAEGCLPELPGWLAAQSEGAIVTSEMMDGWHWQQVWALSDSDQRRLLRGGWFRPNNHGVLSPDLDSAVTAASRVTEPEQRVRRNAWRMLSHILRRCPDVLQNSSAR